MHFVYRRYGLRPPPLQVTQAGNMTTYKNPVPTVDCVICHPEKGVVLVRRKNPPLGWALPGGFVDYGERVEDAARREALEETSLRVRLVGLLGVYSNPARDPRQHTISTVFLAVAENPEAIRGADDALEARYFSFHSLPDPLVFDHKQILEDALKRLPLPL